MTAESPDLNLLVALRALLEETNVTRAGERIRMGQSTMSVALSRLREQFDDELLVRVGRGLSSSTPLARQLLPRVQATLPLIEQILELPAAPVTPAHVAPFAIQLTDYAAVEIRPLLHAIAGSALTSGSTSFGVRRPRSRGTGALQPRLRGRGTRGSASRATASNSSATSTSSSPTATTRPSPTVRSRWMTSCVTRTLDSTSARCSIRFNGACGNSTSRSRCECRRAASSRCHRSSPAPICSPSFPAASRSDRPQATGTVAVPTPFESVELIERLWWHPARAHDPAHRWFREEVVAVVERGVLA